MAGQEQTRPTRRDEEPSEDDAPAVPTAAASTTSDEDIDALLDDIDEALEANAESFVRQFQQKGGQ